MKWIIFTLLSGITFLPHQVYALKWDDTPCVFGNNKKVQMCKETKGDAILKGKQGYLHTFTFTNGKKFYWFYGQQSILCTWKDTYVKEHGKSDWFTVSPSCTDDGWINFSLPSGSRLFKIGQSEY